MPKFTRTFTAEQFDGKNIPAILDACSSVTRTKADNGYYLIVSPTPNADPVTIRPDTWIILDGVRFTTVSSETFEQFYTPAAGE
jgi:hypothetical protein